MGYVDLDSLREIESADKQYSAAIEQFEQARRQVSEKIRAKLQEDGITLQTLANVANVNKGGLSRRLRDVFSLPPTSLRRISASFFNMSCHELLFGEKAATILPKHLAAFASEAGKLTNQKKNRILYEVMKIYDEENKKGAINTEIPAAQVIRDRIFEMADENYITAIQVLGKDAPAGVKTGLKKYTCGDDFTGTLSTLMYYAFALNTTIDYLIVLDYTEFTPLVYRQDGKLKPVTDSIIIQVISKYLRMSPEGQAEAMGQALKIIWES